MGVREKVAPVFSIDDMVAPKCRHCNSPLTLPMIDLGASPPSNALNASRESKEKHYPLRVLVCTSCWLAQTDISLFKLDHDELFTDEYPYFSSTSESWVKHAHDFVEMATKRFNLGPDSMTVEIGANDGYLLQFMKTPCYGVEPTRTGERAQARGIRIYPQFFTSKWADNAVYMEQVGSGKGHKVGMRADLMIANNVLAHVPDVNDFVRGFSILLKDSGVAVFEFPHLLNLVRENQFDTIYHEHYSYLSLTAVCRIFNANGLHVFDVEKIPTHGGSLRVYASKHDAWTDMSVINLLNEEARAGITSPEFYAQLQGAANGIKNDLVEFLLRAKRMGRTVCAFGAAAKGNTLLNYAGVKGDLISYVVDDTPAKQGKFLPGSRIPVQANFSTKPDYVLVLPWNFRDEITRKLSFIRGWGGKFVFAIPQLEIA